MTTRLAKYIAQSGLCSRRAASRLIDAHRVTVNHRLANHIDHVTDNDKICVDGEVLAPKAQQLVLALNKPVGVDCNCDPTNPDSIVHIIAGDERVFPVGRLDKDSHGLMLLTNDGELCQQLLHPDFYHEKEYLVAVDRPFDASFVSAMQQGVSIPQGITRPCSLLPVSDNQFKLTLTQGWNRQIRKMCKQLGYRVIDLQRIRMVTIKLNALPLGEIRRLSHEEVNTLSRAVQPI
ncbi:pseudouridine synthase [Flocculibacter collagenilyticus]|uniref:pseudouridine synthase n=1 Tax=Flocculibacter collagenilyticus TaxID=2744479 RepID=UPI0018F7ABCB|nr:pseudouridine synthase [Flocculibacter collagenilyticus]